MFENALTKYGGIVLGSLLSAVVWCTPEFIFDKKDSELLAALIIGLLGQTVIVINNMAELKIQNEKTQKEELSKVVDLLKVHNDYFSNEWLFSVLTRISQVHRMSANKPYDLMRIKKTINDSLDSCFRLVNVPFEYKIPSGELGRIVKLNEAVSLAQNTIFAVTVDKGNYFDEFWQPLNNDYIKLNVEAGLKGVRVERIFILT